MSQLAVRRLGPADAAAFRALRIEAFTLDSGNFRSGPASVEALTQADIEARLVRDHVVGAFNDSELVGIAGLERFVGEKLEHKGLLWGMYVRAAHRGSRAADLLMQHIVDAARLQVETLLLTVVASNHRAVRFYERWGVRTYGIEPASVKQPDASYLDEALMALSLVARGPATPQ